jgi:putative protein-disulfide isomerase
MNNHLQSVLYHVHDPMCSWCWGYRQTWNNLRDALPEEVRVVNVLGGLAADSNQPMPLEQRETIAGYWRAVTAKTGAEFNFDFWAKCTPRRSTYPACRAVLAAASQSAEQAMIDAIQHAYYLRAMNPSDDSTLIELAGELELDQNRFAADLRSPGTQQALEREFSLRRKLGVRAFPSLVLKQGEKLVPVIIDYRSHETALAEIAGAML